MSLSKNRASFRASERKRHAEHREVARLVRRLFPDVKTIADVAGDDGTLAKCLRRAGYIVTTIDPGPARHLRGTERRCLTRAAPTEDSPGYWPEKFVTEMAKEFDLVVALHPCDATREVALAAKHTRVLIVPCCFKWGSFIRREPPPKFRRTIKNGKATFKRRKPIAPLPDVKPTLRRAWKRLGIEWMERELKTPVRTWHSTKWIRDTALWTPP